MIDVEMLGPLVLRVQGRPARLGPMQRALVVALACAEAALVCQQAIVGLQAHGLNASPMEELQHHILNRTLPRRGLLAA